MDIQLIRSGYRCRRCDTPFRADTPVHCDLRVYTAFLEALRCDICGAKSADILLGLNLSEAEDIAIRATGSIAARAANWCNQAETGQSSMTIYRFFITGAIHHGAIPSDLSDLRRCVRLLEHIPEWKPRMTEMARVPGWERLGPSFNELAKLYRSEAANLDQPAPKTAALLRSLTQPIAA